MITEDYISFETAKLLKEKGFNEECKTAYFNKSIIVDYTMFGFCLGGELLYCPTLQMTMKWLRKNHNKFIEICIDKSYNFENIVFRPSIYDESLHCLWESDNFLTYEEACEAAIKYCIKNLI